MKVDVFGSYLQSQAALPQKAREPLSGWLESAKKSGVGVSQAEVSLRPNPSSDWSRELFYAAYARWSPIPDPRLFDAL